IFGPLLVVVSNQFVYGKVLDWSRLGSMQLNCCVVIAVIGLLVGFYPWFAMAVIAWLTTQTVQQGFQEQAQETQMSLYPMRFREAIVFCYDHTFYGIGMCLAGLLVFIEPVYRVGAFAAVVLGMLVMSKRHNDRFARGVVRLLSSNDIEERRNAIALYDRLEAQDEYEEFLYYLNEGSDHETSIAILKTFSALRTVQPMPEILNLLSQENLDNSLRIAILGYIDVLDFKTFDPFLHYRTVETLKKICLESHSNVARAMAIRIFVQNAPAEESVNFVLEELESADNRVVANAIEGLSHLNYPGVVKLLSPYLKHSIARIRANTIVALWKYPKARFRVKASITSMLFSDELSHRISGTHATGKVRDDSYQSQLVKQLENAAPALRRVTLIALVELGNLQYLDDIVDLILGNDEAHARNTCYLAMSLEPHLLNEGIVARLFLKGPEAREVAAERFATCGRLCRKQLDLLAGRTDRLTRRAFV
ncbi:MAG: HEAT repeat domain-containing protein, partial [Myxococcota bacterium]|nr:HEAT repeat domain-containing protein [Myxococcota bacterium]